MTVAQLRSFFRKGRAKAYAWPGGYPMYYLCSDGGILCPKCLTAERKQVFRSTATRSRDGWRLDAADINMEDPFLYCDHCNARIESAYAEEEA